MKRFNFILFIFLLVLTGCGRDRKLSGKDETFIIVNVNKNPLPKKELILQDFMDVEYIALETSDEFLCQGNVLDVGKEILLVSNNTQEGDIFVFDRNGKGIRKINHRGQGAGEYLYITGATLDEDNDEIFVNDYIGGKILVYDLYGEFKRNLKSDEGFKYDNIYNFDKENLICEVGYDKRMTDKKTFAVISKQDGSLVNKTQISARKKKSTVVNDDKGKLLNIYLYPSIMPFYDNWILIEESSDTIFTLLPDFHMTPFIARMPSVRTMNPEIFMFPRMLTNRYFFMEKIRMKNGFSKVELMYDRQNKTMYEYTLYNNDYADKQHINIMTWETKNDEIAFWKKLEVHELVEFYTRDKLKGKLKDIASELTEDSNPVIMLMRNKSPE